MRDLHRVNIRQAAPDDDSTRFRVDPIDGNIRFDNFQLANSWFTRSIRKVDREGGVRQEVNFNKEVEYVDRPTQHKGRPGDLHFRTMPAHAQTRYAAALEKQSVLNLQPTFAEVARNEWRRALSAWKEFGDFEWPAFRYESQMVRVDDSMNPERFVEPSVTS